MKKFIVAVFLMSCMAAYGESYNFVDVIDEDESVTYTKSGIVLTFNSEIDWTDDEITVRVSEKRKVKESKELIERYTVLKAEALNRAATILDYINIDSENTISDFKEKSGSFTQKLSMFISGVEIKERSYKKGVITCSVTIPMCGAGDSITSIVADEYMANYYMFDFDFLKLFTKECYAAEESGIIIDARKSDIKTAILPKVVTKNGTVYNPKDVDKEELAKNGAVQYIVVGSKVDEKVLKKQSQLGKKELQKSGTNPIIMKSYSAKGKLKTDAVISQEDAKKIQNSEALKTGKVTIIVDAKVGGIIGQVGDYDIILVAWGR